MLKINGFFVDANRDYRRRAEYNWMHCVDSQIMRGTTTNTVPGSGTRPLLLCLSLV